jgi:hypothetical protein
MYESGNEQMCANRDLPWLQDTADGGVWDAWEHEYRDVIILNPNGEAVGVYNLTWHNLGSAEDGYYDTLKSMLLLAAGIEWTPPAPPDAGVSADAGF